jgi:spore germination protein GerM
LVVLWLLTRYYTSHDFYPRQIQVALHPTRTLHSELQTLLACPSPNPHLLQTKITQYIALMVEEDKPDHSQELMFE